MMKKILAGFIILFFGFMSFVLVQGFLDKNKDDTNNATTKTTKPADSNNTETTSPTDSSKQFTKAVVAKHATKSDCWLIISGKVYDVTTFIDEHPGGAGRIIPNCGKDATTAFQTQDGEGSHSGQANSMLADYLIGSLQ